MFLYADMMRTPSARLNSISSGVRSSRSLNRMRAAYDDILADGLKRRHPVNRIVGALLQAEIADKTARSIKYQMTSARLPMTKELARLRLLRLPGQ